MAPQRKKSTQLSNLLHQTYYTPANAGSYGGVKALYFSGQKKKPKLKLGQVNKWLSTQDTYTLHKPALKQFQQSRTIVNGIDDQWQADLIDLKQLALHNQGFKYLLTCIDIFSKYAWVKPLKSKTGTALLTAWKTILQCGRKPNILQCDKGKEFVNAEVQQYLKKQNIHFFTIHNEETKASVVERFNQTLKSNMWRYFTNHDTRKYIGVLDDLVKTYNHRYHRSIRRAPVEVTDGNEEEVWHCLYGNQNLTYPKPKFLVGDTVRISKVKQTFKKGYLPNWSEELFTITERTKSWPWRYSMKDKAHTIL